MSLNLEEQSMSLQCEKCSCNFAQEDSFNHQANCPPTNNNWNHAFVSNQVLHSTIQIVKSEDLTEDLSNCDPNNLVFISEFAMKLCNFAKGDPIVLTTKDTIVVRTAWPLKDRNLMGVSLTEHGSELNNLTGLVKLYLIKSNVFPVHEITIQQVGTHSFRDVPTELLVHLKLYNNGKIHTVGNHISVEFYGMILRYKILEMKGEGGKRYRPNFIKSFQKLDLTNATFPDPTKAVFYKTLYSSTWNILTNARKRVHYKRGKDVKIEDVGGYDRLISDIKSKVDIGIGKCKKKFVAGCTQTGKGVLLHGPSGSGKSTIANAVIIKCDVEAYTFHCSDIYSKSVPEFISNLKEVFKDAIMNSPSIILLEDVDIVCSKVGTNFLGDYPKLILGQLILLFDDLHKSDDNVVVIATTTTIDNVDISLRRDERLCSEFEVDVPNTYARKEILFKLVPKVPNTLSNRDILQISTATNGYLASDLCQLCMEARYAAAERYEENVTAPKTALTVIMNDFVKALRIIKPSHVKEILVETSKIQWSDIGGLDDVKRKLREVVERSLMHPRKLLEIGGTPSKGILMYGPPGCSKTMMAKALANNNNIRFLNVQATTLLSKFVGESEKAVKKLFQRARRVSPSIIFIDEIDALGCERDSSASGTGNRVHERILSQLLIELDGITTVAGNVVLIAATNRPDKIDEALLRSGRLGHLLYVGLPDKKCREHIFNIKLRKISMAKDVNIEEMVSWTEGYSGAEIHAICNEAVMKAFEENVNFTLVTKDHFKAAFLSVTPRTSSALMKIYEDFTKRGAKTL